MKVGLIFLISSEKLSYVINVLDITNIMRQSACLVFKVIVGHIFETSIQCLFHPISVKFCLYVL